MAEEEKVLDKSEQKQIKDNTTQILKQIRCKPVVPIQLTISGKGDKGKQELGSFLEILEKLRHVKYLGGLINDETQIVETELTREKTNYNPYSKTDDWIEKYKAEGGLILQILNKKGVIKVNLKEDLERGGENILGGLTKLLKIWTDAEELSFESLRKPNGEIIGAEIVMQIKKLNHVTNLEKTLLKQITLYQNMKESLFKTMKEIKKQRKLNPKRLLDDIEFYTNFSSDNLKELERMTKLTYFLRDVYSIMETENNVTIDMVKSNLKSRKIAANRHALMFLCRNKFPWLSSSNIGIVFSNYGARPKNHATVLMACKLFNTRVKGVEVKDYPNEEYSAKGLLYDAENRHLTWLKRTNKKYKNYTIEDIFKFKPK